MQLRKELATTYRGITDFHITIASYFYRNVASDHAYRQFEPDRYRAYINRQMRTFRHQVSALAALAVDEALPKRLVARFQDWLLIEGGKPKVLLEEVISQKLSEAFPDETFSVEVTE